MDPLLIGIFAFIGGTLFGVVIMASLNRQSEEKRKIAEEKIVEAVKNQFKAISLDTLKTSTDNVVQAAEQQLNSKKELIDKTLDNMDKQLGSVTTLVREFEEKRAKTLGELGQELTNLTQTSNLLQKALGDNRSRGQWGERIAEDILKLAGLQEGINYKKQQSTESGSRPDFTFILPNEKILNMDTKFPLDNYMKSLQAEAETDKKSHQDSFLKDVRKRIKEIKDRGYINPEQNTVDCVLIFIPNEQIYRFIHETDDTIIDTALQDRVIVCSPLTLFVVLAIVRQASENFALEQSSREILILLNKIKTQWKTYVTEMNNLDNHLYKARDSFNNLIGVRSQTLDKHFRAIDDLMVSNNILEEKPDSSTV